MYFDKKFILTILVLISSCREETPNSRVQSFHSQQNGKHTYLLTHYDIIEAGDSEPMLKNPFGQDLELTAEQLTILRDSFQQVGQCVYQVSADVALNTADPSVFKQMLADAKPLSKEQHYMPLTQVLQQMQGMRELYGYRMPWYYDYLAMGLGFIVLNGIFDIATHNAQGELIDIASKYMASDVYQKRGLTQYDQPATGRIHEVVIDMNEDLERQRQDIEDLEDLAKDTRKGHPSADGSVEFVEQAIRDADKLADRVDDLLLNTAKSEHKAEELFGRFLYAGHEIKIFGKTINPFWALKEGMGKKLVPLVKKYCFAAVALKLCLPIIIIGAGGIIGATIPFSSLFTGKMNSIIHRRQEQQTLDDLVGDWDVMRTFTHVKPEVMSKLQKKLRDPKDNLLSKVTATFTGRAQDRKACPPAKSLSDHYIDPVSGRFR